jgi:exosome complex exonuclease DIS3/RRP44
MEFFQSHTPETHTDKGIIICKDDEFYLKDGITPLKNNRAINGDIVFIKDDEVVGIESRNKQHIVGILYLNLNQKYGFTKRGIPIIKFTPLSNKFPTFMVPSKSRERVAQLCVISFNKWETNNKHPIGQIEKLIGRVGDLNNEIQGILYKNKMCPLGKSKQRRKQNILSEEQIQSHPWIESESESSTSHYETISIDPEGCRDIDDAFHVKQIDESNIEIGIHIADVASRLDLENLKCCFFSSIYFDGGKQENMLNDDFTYTVASLGNGEVKRAVSLILQYKIDPNVKLMSLCFKSTLVKNKALSYSEADKMIKSDSSTKHTLNSSLKLLNKIAFMMNNETSSTPYTIISATKMVEHFMLLYNSLTAETLYSYSKTTILRKHKNAEKLSTLNQTVSRESSPELVNFIERLSQNAAEYVIDYNAKDGQLLHEGLGFGFYTHATSPIRRYVDIINQINILRYISSQPALEVSKNEIDDINLFNKNLRKFYNNYKKLKLVFNSEIETRDYNAYIIQIKKNKVKLFIPELDIEHSCQIMSHKLESLDRISLGDANAQYYDQCEYNWIEVDGIRLSLYDSVKVNITTLPKEVFFNKKLYCKIVSPEISVF